MSAHVTSGVWICAQEQRRDTRWLCNNGIRLIVDCRDVDTACDGPPLDSYTPPVVLRCGMRDDDRVLTNQWSIKHRIDRLNTAAAAIQSRVQRNESVLVHCVSGVNRSALVIAWWLMLFAEPRRDYQDAVSLLVSANQTRNEPVLINPAFQQFLVTHANKKQPATYLHDRLHR